MNITEAIKLVKAEIEMRKDQIRVLGVLNERLPNETELTICGQYIDFDYPESRQRVTEILQLVGGGKWEKEKHSETTINYINSSFSDRVKVRIYGAPPPPSCRMVEEEVIIPAQPERREKVLKMVCPEPVEATV